jgi:hypothetical protein
MTNYDIDFIHFLDQRDFLEALSYGELRYMRSALRNIWNAVQMERPINDSQVDSLIKGLDSAQEKLNLAIDKIMKKKNKDCQEYFRMARTKARLSAKIAPAGHSTSAVYRLLLAHAGHEKYLKALPFSLYMEHNENEVL